MLIKFNHMLSETVVSDGYRILTEFETLDL